MSSDRAQRRSLTQRVVYDLFRLTARLITVLAFGMRCRGRRHIPPAGGALVCANHQSSLDPPLIGLAFNRRLNYLARRTLFDIPVFCHLIAFLDAIPIDRDGMGLAGLKETLKRLRRGELVLMFPEGSRTNDGQVSRLKPGFVALARRGKVPLLPVGLDGAFDALPRGAVIPRPQRLALVIGEPIFPELAETLDDDELIAELEHRIRHCHAEARRIREMRLLQFSSKSKPAA